MREAGLEPASLKAGDFKSPVYTIPPLSHCYVGRTSQNRTAFSRVKSPDFTIKVYILLLYGSDGRTRTNHTMIFSHVLYLMSYVAIMLVDPVGIEPTTFAL